MQRALFLAVLLAAAGADALPAALQNGKRSAPSWEQIAHLSFEGIEKNPVRLRNGVREKGPTATGGAGHPRIELLPDFRLTGDLDGDGTEEAAVLLSSLPGGSGTFLYLAVAAWRGPAAENITTLLLGDRIQVYSGRIIAGRIELDVVQAGPGDPACCPSQTAMRRWTMARTGLQEEPAKVRGTLSLQDLGRQEWQLTRLAQEETIPSDLRITLRVDGNRLSGSGGCNRYSAPVESAAAGQISVGSMTVTQMSCGETIDRFEGRFRKALQHARRFAFLAGKLTLTYPTNGGTVQTLVFAPLKKTDP